MSTVSLNEFFDMHCSPFSNTNPKFSKWFSKKELGLQQIMVSLIDQGSSFVLIGSPGVGKSTFIRDILSSLDNNDYISYLLPYSGFTRNGLLRSLADIMELDIRGRTIPPLAKIQKHIFQLRNKSNLFPIIVIDDAQELLDQSFSDLCSLLIDPVKGTTSCTMIFIGDQYLKQKLRLNVMSSIYSRMNVILDLDTLTKEESFEFIFYRLQKAKAPKDLFDKSVLELISASCKGNRREILKKCTTLLLEAYRRQEQVVSAEIFHSCDLLKTG